MRFEPGDDATLEQAREEIVTFLRERTIEAERETLIIPLDGSIGSVVVALLAVDALDTERVFGLGFTTRSENGVLDESLVASGLGIRHCRVDLATVVDRFEDAIAPDIAPDDGVAPINRVRDRLRTACTYFAADATNGVVAGTLDRTGWLLGTVTKFGGTGVDLLPLRHLYATEVEALATHMDVPTAAVETGPRIREYWPNAPDHPVEVIDFVLDELIDRDRSIEEVATDADLAVEIVRRYARRHAETRHLRRPPAAPAGDTSHDFFHEIELRFSGE